MPGKSKLPYGPKSEANYADPGYQGDGVARYPLDTEEHVRAAIAYLSMPKNSSRYDESQLKKMWAKIRKAAEEYVGAENVVDIDITLGAEDFSYYSQIVPAAFYRLGTNNVAKGITSYVHTPTFDIDEDALLIGPGLMAWMALQELLVTGEGNGNQ